jgi:2-amino-4-hydroxy-6-hydroxymethyldihydropteridine diphosphokinase
MLIPVGIALGSNLGDRQAELDSGVVFLRALSCNGIVRESTRIETLPVDCPPGSDSFLNAVAEIELDPAVLPPLELLARLQDFERRRGRPREHGRNSPRSLDLDILYYGEVVSRTRELTIPHPRLAERLFVLEPLAQLRPDLVLAGQTRTVSQLLRLQRGGTPGSLD